MRITYNEKYKPKIYLIVVPHELFVRDFFVCGKEMHYVRFIRRKLNDCWCYFDCVGVAMIGWGFEWNQDITNDKRVGTVVRDIGVMVLATGIIFVMQRAMN